MYLTWLIAGIETAKKFLSQLHTLDQAALAALDALLVELHKANGDTDEEKFGNAMGALPEETRVAVQSVLDEIVVFGAETVGDDTEADEVEPLVSFGIGRRLRGVEGSQRRRAMEGDRFLRRSASREAVRLFKEQGGDVNDVQSFLEWLLANADQIIAFIQKLIALFAV